MTVTVLVQAYGPFEASGAGYRWITVQELEEPEDFDLDSLKKKAMEAVKGFALSEMTRLIFKKDGKPYMKTIFYDMKSSD